MILKIKETTNIRETSKQTNKKQTCKRTNKTGHISKQKQTNGRGNQFLFFLVRLEKVSNQARKEVPK